MRHWIVVAAALVAAGCAGGGAEREAPMRTWDLGSATPRASLAPARAGAVRAAAPYDAPDMLYRLAFRDPAEVLAFAQNRWAAAPSVLLHRQFARAARGPSGPCALEFEVTEFAQVFAARDASAVVLEGRAALVAAGGQRAAERVFRIDEPGAGATPAEGAAAFARAADRLVADIGAWSSGLAVCRAN